MLRINEYGIEPTVYRHANGELYVVTEIVTHMDKDGDMQQLGDPLVIFRDLNVATKHVSGQPPPKQPCYAKLLHDFKQKFTKQ